MPLIFSKVIPTVDQDRSLSHTTRSHYQLSWPMHGVASWSTALRLSLIVNSCMIVYFKVLATDTEKVRRACLGGGVRRYGTE